MGYNFGSSKCDKRFKNVFVIGEKKAFYIVYFRKEGVVLETKFTSNYELKIIY